MSNDDACCLNCRFFEQTGWEDSGIRSHHDKSRNWFYEVGKCAHPDPPYEKAVSWASCWRFRAKRKRRKGSGSR